MIVESTETAGIRGVVEDWQRKLLQFDRRNGLLYFRPGRSAVLIQDHTPDKMASRLDSSRRGLKFDYTEPRGRGSRRRRPGQSAANSAHDQSEAEPPIIRGDLRSDCPTLELQRRLGNLRRRSKEWQEEQGLNVLFLALGMLRWIDEDGVEAVAPLLLLPAQLDRQSPHDPFVLTEDDDDITLNHTLAAKLEHEFGLELPELDSEVPSDYFQHLRVLITAKPGWSLEQSVYLSNFGFSKLAMWRDLDRIRREGTDHRVVRTLAGESVARNQHDSDALPMPLDQMEAQVAGGLDDVLDIRDQHTVLPADYSQLIAMAGAKFGSNLVVHGPPGTGKSQTIANIISASIAEGKTVLFVSEKTAALDVVKQRLDENELGVFCLDLHSERGGKSSVYEQLRQTVEDKKLVDLREFDYISLATLRRALNDAVRALHKRRDPLGMTVYQMHGRLAELRERPHAGFDIKNVESLDPDRLGQVRSASNRIAQRSQEFREHHTSRWHAMKMTQPSLELSNVIRADMDAIDSTVRLALDHTTAIAEDLGTDEPRGIAQAQGLGRLAGHLSCAPGLPGKWVNPGTHMRLRNIANREAEQQKLRSGIVERLKNQFSEQALNWEFKAIRGQIQLLPTERRLLESLVGTDFGKRLTEPGLPVFGLAERLGNTIDTLNQLFSQLAESLNLKPADNVAGIRSQIETAAKIANLVPVPDSWIVPGVAHHVATEVGDARDFTTGLIESESDLFSNFEETVLDVVDQPMLARYRINHLGSIGRVFSGMFGSYKQDRNLLRSLSVAPERLTFENELRYVQLANDITRRRGQWSAKEGELRELLGSRYRGRATDWNSVAGEIETVNRLITNWTGLPSSLAALLTNPDKAAECKNKADTASEYLDVVLELMREFRSEILGSFVLHQSGLSEIAQKLKQAMPILGRLEAAITEPAQAARRPLDSLDALNALLEDGIRLREIEYEQERASADLAADFGDRYAGFDTNWADVSSALDWCGELQSLLASRRPSGILREHCANPKPESHYSDSVAVCERVTSSLSETTKTVATRFVLTAGPWDRWEDAYFDDITAWARDFSDNADTASDWLIYRAACRDLDKALGDGAVESIRALTDIADDVPAIVERRVATAWLDRVYSTEPLLVNFTSADQDDVRAKFRSLDRRLPVAARNEVRRKVFSTFPTGLSASTTAGQLGILRGELSKRRRQLPVRRLLERIPALIQTIKPCFLMSPLAVSQYIPVSDLESETLSFDVVIFDEASQIFPEDAVPAILRGKQVILAGDRKQLPPSAFWRSSLSEDEYESDDEDDGSEPINQLAGRESILDAAVGQIGSVFAEAHLNVHYRSRDEHLIQFSNHYFYDDRLLTFPSPGLGDEWFGLHDIYVPDGVFDRDNRVEAEKVVDIVFQHMRTRPIDESIGVVAMSRRQADLITQIIENRRLAERDLDDRFSEGRHEPFFVKNLENVQGDERDHMILSVGYGPDRLGRVYNRFGPINQQGGERRLNVAITRAKLRLTVVHSMKPTDITSPSQGARLLRRFLEFVTNPGTAIEGEAVVDAGAEYESPFEEMVGRALIERGHRVVRQIGVAGYRIDLGIMAEDGSGIDLGIECDGKTYHSSPAARDRDWLRQEVLERLGWTIHRVWSTSWVRNPQGEIEAIEMALEEARDRKAIPFTSIEQRDDGHGERVSDSEAPPDCTANKVPMENSPAYEEYVEASLKGVRRGSFNRLRDAIVEIVEVEGPVHYDVVVRRLLDHHRMVGRNAQFRESIATTVRSALSSRSIRMQDEFLWRRKWQLTRKPRIPGSGSARRKIEHISPIELKTAMLMTVREMFGGSEEEVLRQTARNLGYRRSGSRITRRLSEVFAKMLNDGDLAESFGSIVEGRT